MIKIFECSPCEDKASVPHQEEEWQHIDGMNSVIAVPELYICDYCGETFKQEEIEHL